MCERQWSLEAADVILWVMPRLARVGAILLCKWLLKAADVIKWSLKTADVIL